MASELIFSATRSVANRYLLCRIVAKTVRTLHFASSNTQDAITDAFTRIGNNLEMSTRSAPGLTAPSQPGFVDVFNAWEDPQWQARNDYEASGPA